MLPPRESNGILIDFGGMDAAAEAARRLVGERAKAKNLALATISKQIGRSHSYIQQYVSRGSPRFLPERERAAVAQMLGIQPEQLAPPPLVPLAPPPPGMGLPYDARTLRKLIVRAFVAEADKSGPEFFADKVIEAYERIQKARIEAGLDDDPLVTLALFKDEN